MKEKKEKVSKVSGSKASKRIRNPEEKVEAARPGAQSNSNGVEPAANEPVVPSDIPSSGSSEPSEDEVTSNPQPGDSSQASSEERESVPVEDDAEDVATLSQPGDDRAESPDPEDSYTLRRRKKKKKGRVNRI